MKIMLADDEENIRELVKLIMTEKGYDFYECSDGFEAIELFRREAPDLAILDVMMPRRTGFEVCEEIRNIQPEIPVIFLSAKGDIVDKKSGYKVGADDYMTKPFDGEELLLHVEALLRRSGKTKKVESSNREGLFSVGDFEFNLRRYEIFQNGKKIDLAPKELQILVLLATHKGEVFTREDIVENVWGEDYLASGVNVAVYIRHIRQKIEKDPSHPKLIRTIRRVGYRFDDSNEEYLQYP
jgi:two-component system response regulator VicR